MVVLSVYWGGSVCIRLECFVAGMWVDAGLFVVVLSLCWGGTVSCSLEFVLGCDFVFGRECVVKP